MQRRTKIVTTLGPGTDNPEILEQLILAGANVVRLNFSHGTSKDHKNRAKMVRKLSKKHNNSLGIIGDLQGPKIRIARFINKQIELQSGDHFTLDAGLDDDMGDQTQVGIDYKALPSDVDKGDQMWIKATN